MADNATFDELPRHESDRLPLLVSPASLPRVDLRRGDLPKRTTTTRNMDEPESVVLPDPGELPFINTTMHPPPSQPVEVDVLIIERNSITPPPVPSYHSSESAPEPQASSSLSSNSSSSTVRTSALPPITADQLNQPHYIIGASTFYDSFFGGTELERYFPDRKMRVSVITWNMNSNPPSDYSRTLQELLNLNEKSTNEELPELYVMGFQETPSADSVLDSIKVGVQASLGPNYVLLKWAMLGTLHASIWIRRELLWSCTAVEVVPINLRPHPANRIRTKGAIALSFCLFGTTFLFINTHLSAHETNLRTRMNQLDKMQHILNLRNERREKENEEIDLSSGSGDRSRGRTPRQRTHRTRNSEYIFWFGDLNFRLELPGDSVLEFIKQIATADSIDSKAEIQKELMRSDQLSQLMSRGIIFQEFEEAQWPPSFLPTYKCKVGGPKESSEQNWVAVRPRPLTPVGLALRETAAHSRHSDSDSVSSSPLQQRASRQSTASSDTTATSSDPLNADTLGEPSHFDLNEEDLGDATTRQLLDNLMRLSQGYDATRVPSYTDRILYQAVPGKSQEKLPMGSLLHCFHYSALTGLNSSDHKPVTALFEVSLEPGGPRLPTRIKRLSQMMEEIKLKGREPNLQLSSSGTNLNRILTKRNFFSRKPGKASPKSKDAQRHLQTMSMSRLDRLAQLNAGAFDRNIYIEGLRLRNNILEHQGSMDGAIELTKPVTGKRTREIVKSQSLDSNVIDIIEVQSLNDNQVEGEIEVESHAEQQAAVRTGGGQTKSTSSICSVM